MVGSKPLKCTSEVFRQNNDFVNNSHLHHQVLLTDIEDCEVSGQDDDEGFLWVFPQRLVRTILVRDKAALVIRIGENYALATSGQEIPFEKQDWK